MNFKEFLRLDEIDAKSVQNLAQQLQQAAQKPQQAAALAANILRGLKNPAYQKDLQQSPDATAFAKKVQSDVTALSQNIGNLINSLNPQEAQIMQQSISSNNYKGIIDVFNSDPKRKQYVDIVLKNRNYFTTPQVAAKLKQKTTQPAEKPAPAPAPAAPTAAKPPATKTAATTAAR